MRQINLSMRTSITMTICLMGAMGIVLAVYMGNTYQNLALENHRNSFNALIDLAVEDQLRNAKNITRDFSDSIQKDGRFRDIFLKRDLTLLTNELDTHFRRYFVTAVDLNVYSLIVYDTDLNFLAASTGDSDNENNHYSHCPDLIQKAKNRTGANRLKSLHQLCDESGQPLLSMIVPIGGLRVYGFLNVTIDPIPNIKNVEAQLGMPLKIINTKLKAIYISERWPDDDQLDNILNVPYQLINGSNESISTINLAYDITQLRKTLNETRLLILFIASITIIITALIAVRLLDLVAISPIRRLASHIQIISKNPSHFKAPIEIKHRGIKEVNTLACNFNEMINELNVTHDKMETMAFTDPLTLLPNRTLFYDRLNQLILANERKSDPFTLFMMDLDRFKVINDTLGHHIGDLLLQHACDRLTETVRNSDTIARLGGDEFALLLPTVNEKETAISIAERIIESISDPYIVEGHNLKVSISIGIVQFPIDGDNANVLLKHADVAMYSAKLNHLGYVFYESSQDNNSLLDMTLESDLKTALDNNKLQLYFQPKVHFKNRQTYGVEALSRWEHPKRGFISPDIFIPLAEQTGLIKLITNWVLNTVFDQAADWRQKGIHLDISVNLSANDLDDPNLLQLIGELLDKSSIDPTTITFELTESAIMLNPMIAMRTFSELNKMGFKLSVDDFGTGYSSLSYLKRLPVDEIKIDRSFVMDMENDKNDEVIVRSTIDLGHNMGMIVTAEGIESETTWNILKKLGCDHGQGYYICRPVDASALEQWLAESSWAIKKNDNKKIAS